MVVTTLFITAIEIHYEHGYSILPLSMSYSFPITFQEKSKLFNFLKMSSKDSQKDKEITKIYLELAHIGIYDILSSLQ